MFEKASRLNLRFDTQAGNLTVEDLWDLPLISRRGESLDNMYKVLNREVKAGTEESLVTEQVATNTVLNLKFDIVKHVITVKLAEQTARQKEAETKAKKEQILAIIADKQDDELKGKGVDELKALLAAL